MRRDDWDILIFFILLLVKRASKVERRRAWGKNCIAESSPHHHCYNTHTTDSENRYGVRKKEGV